MNYYVGRDGTQLGTFSLDQLKSDLANGKLRPTDMAWCEGMDDWKPLSEVLEATASAPVSTPPIPPAIPSLPQPLSVPQVPVSAMPAMEPRTSKLAVWSLVCGIATVFCSCITGIPAIIMGIMALNRIGKSQGALGGKGLAIAGLCCACTLGITGTAMMAGLAVPAFNQVQERAKIMQATTNARQIVIAIKGYAGDQSGNYPDADRSASPQTSNDAFRLLFVAGLMEDERPFTAENSAYEPDNIIGSPPDFRQALEAGENHWAMTKGLSDSSDGNAPLIFENPVEASWPPMWDCNQSGKKVPGRAWRSGKIIIARNDGSVMAEQLESIRGDSVPLKAGPDGKDLFTRFMDPGEFLDVLRK